MAPVLRAGTAASLGNTTGTPELRMLVLDIGGGNDIIVDNFNDTGRIDCEPKELLAGVVQGNRAAWLREAIPESS